MSQPSLLTLIGKNLLDAMKNAPNIGESKKKTTVPNFWLHKLIRKEQIG